VGAPDPYGTRLGRQNPRLALN